MKDLKKHECIHILKTNYIGHLSFVWKNKPFVLPITYYYNEEDNSIISYSGEGHKINAMRINNSVCFGVSEIESVNIWESLIAHGEFEELTGTFAKQQLHKFVLGLKKILLIKENKRPQLISDFSSKILSNTSPIVYRVKISEMTGKYRRY